MIFNDLAIHALDLTTAAGIQELIEVHLCGHSRPSPLGASDQRLLQEFVTKAAPTGITFQQFNELLLVLNQDRVSRAFFDFFFRTGDVPLSMEILRQGVVKFKGFAMVCFGNFRFAYRQLSTVTTTDALREELGPCCFASEDIDREYGRRTEKVLDVSLIAREHTWFVGEITGGIVAKELRDFEEYQRSHPSTETDDEAIEFAARLSAMDESFKSVQNIALRNTDVYLTWDHLDVYVATSMRNQWEYEETFDFTHRLFGHPVLAPLKLRYFDPTQSKCAFTRDKGLLEGLMLKRAACTIYMAQESDTLGKDSELANTLAQGKPVIAYIPKIDSDEYAKVIERQPLSYVKLRLLHLQAGKIVELIDGLPRLTQEFLLDLMEYRTSQPFELWFEKDDTAFKRRQPNWSELCQKLAEAEEIAFDKRASVLRQYHPLGMQMDLESGVANGVLVVRNADQAARLLHAMLTNRAEFDVRSEPGSRSLVERHSDSVFRAVTDNEKLTNSFWNLWNVEDKGRGAAWRKRSQMRNCRPA